LSERRGGEAMGTRRPGRRGFSAALSLAILALSLSFAGCGGTVSDGRAPLLGGSYTNAQFRFSVTYPAGWKVNESRDATPSQGASLFPLSVSITRAGATQDNSSLVSNLTISILDLHNPGALDKTLLKTVTTRATNSAYHAVTLADRTAYATQPLQQTILGSQQMATHTDYYLQANSLEYHLSTDVLSGDSADDAMKAMLASFTLTA